LEFQRFGYSVTGELGSFATFQTIAAAKKAGSTANVIYESKTRNFRYNEDGDSALVGALLFANAKGIPGSYWVAARHVVSLSNSFLNTNMRDFLNSGNPHFYLI